MNERMQKNETETKKNDKFSLVWLKGARICTVHVLKYPMQANIANQNIGSAHNLLNWKVGQINCTIFLPDTFTQWVQQ